LGESYGAQTKSAGSGQEKFGGFHGNTDLKVGGQRIVRFFSPIRHCAE
jgi:hypothetical protein